LQFLVSLILFSLKHGAASFLQPNIIKEFRKLNTDGSYSFGFEADDGSFRTETRNVQGLVAGKYGFITEGKLKVIEYDSKGIIKSERINDKKGDIESSKEEVGLC
jgi:hypothetical protein